MRKLASIRRIADIQPIIGADAIEVATVDGWKVVVKKDEFKVGDLAVYFEIDSVLPVRDEFEFLRKSSYVKKDWLVTEQNPTGEGFRLKTIKLRGQVSQGLLVPVTSQFKSACTVTVDGWVNFERYEGDDVSDILGVVKWDPPLPAELSGKALGQFPNFIPKTDQERIQNLSDDVLREYAEDDFEVTVKLDGSSMTVFRYRERVGVCSRNLELDCVNSPDTTFARVFIESGLHQTLMNHPGLDGFAIQGELMGPGIQGNRENAKVHTFNVFDVYNINESRYLTAEERINFVDMLVNEYGVNILHCPILDPIKAAAMTKDELLELADGPSIFNPVREGLVFKSIQRPEFSFKAISNKFLLKGGE